MISPAPIPLELSLNAGDHDELKIFLEIRLITSRIDQKLRRKGEVHGYLKRELVRRSWVIDAVVEAFCKGRGSGSTWRGCGFNSATNLTSISLQNEPRSWHDRATIGPRSGHDRALIVVLDLGRPPSSLVGMIPRQKEVPIVARSSSDRAAIGSRSGYHRSSLSCSVCRPMKI